MLSMVSVLTSLLFATTGTSAITVNARAGTCSPAITGKKINIVNRQCQLGVALGACFPDVPIEAEALTIPLVPVLIPGGTDY
jgi:hypothetical protein